MSQRVVAVVGVSGVGKSTSLTKLASSISFQVLHASRLIQEGREAVEGGIVPHDQLRFADIDQNQQFLIQGFKFHTDRSALLVVLDGHTVIEREGGLIPISPAVFREIGIHAMIFLTDDASRILARRADDQSRQRPALSVERLQLIQCEALKQANLICSALSVPLHTCQPSDLDQIEQYLRSKCV